MSDYLRAEARADEVVKLTLEKIGLEEELALLREYHEASEALETLLSNAMWTAEADARLTADHAPARGAGVSKIFAWIS